jgi:phosphoribosylamine-glycine ligase
MKDIYPQDFNFFPRSWNVPSQLTRLKSDLAEAKKKALAKGLAPPVYIVKPSDMAQGKGIFFATDVEQITKALMIENGKLGAPKTNDGKNNSGP